MPESDHAEPWPLASGPQNPLAPPGADRPGSRAVTLRRMPPGPSRGAFENCPPATPCPRLPLSVTALVVLAVVARVRPVLGMALGAEVPVKEGGGTHGLAKPWPRSSSRADVGVRHSTRTGVGLLIVVPRGWVRRPVSTKFGGGTWSACQSRSRHNQRNGQPRPPRRSPDLSKHRQYPPLISVQAAKVLLPHPAGPHGSASGPLRVCPAPTSKEDRSFEYFQTSKDRLHAAIGLAKTDAGGPPPGIYRGASPDSCA